VNTGHLAEKINLVLVMQAQGFIDLKTANFMSPLQRPCRIEIKGKP
jgi:hypothetical protein